MASAAGLLAALGSLPDPRARRGVRHALVTVVAAAVCAVVAGYGSYAAIGEWVADLPADTAAVLGIDAGRRPSEAMIRRLLQALAGRLTSTCGTNLRPAILPAVSSTGSGPQRPAPRQIQTWQDAEHNAAAWMRYWGYRDAQAKPGGADGGIDVHASDALAQVKYQAIAVGRPALQLLFGARGHAIHKQLIFFTGSNYTSTAVTYADEHDIALFVYSLDGSMTAVNPSAWRLSTQYPRPPEEPIAEAKASTDPPPSARLFTRATTAAPDASGSQPALKPPGTASLAIFLTPMLMCLVGAVTIGFFSQNPDLAPPWLRQVWATWMTVACLGSLPALLVARLLSRRQ